MRAVVLAFLGIRRKFSKFIEDYEFVPPGEPLELSTVARMIGNAVPVRIGELLGKSILAHLKSINDARWLSRLIQHKGIYVELGMSKNRAVFSFVENSKSVWRLRDLARAAPARQVNIIPSHQVICGILPELNTLQTRSCREQPQDITEERHCWRRDAFKSQWWDNMRADPAMEAFSAFWHQ